MKQQDCNSIFELFTTLGRPVLTAHATYIGRFPENSLLGVQGAIDAGADMVEMDVRTTRDNVPVLHHDESIERTANAKGIVREMTYNELKKFNFSHFQYFLDCSGRTRPEPLVENCPITRLDDMLENFGRKIFMNIQISKQDYTGVPYIVGVFKDFDMYERAYITVDDFDVARQVRALDSDIELCVLQRCPPNTPNTTMAKLHDFHDFGCHFAQPRWYDITPEYCDCSHELGIYSNVYFANYSRDAIRFIDCGIDGILTDYIDILLPVISSQEAIASFGKTHPQG